MAVALVPRPVASSEWGIEIGKRCLETLPVTFTFCTVWDLTKPSNKLHFKITPWEKPTFHFHHFFLFLFFFFKILNNLDTQRGAWAHSPEIESYAPLIKSARHPIHHFFLIGAVLLSCPFSIFRIPRVEKDSSDTLVPEHALKSCCCCCFFSEPQWVFTDRFTFSCGSPWDWLWLFFPPEWNIAIAMSSPNRKISGIHSIIWKAKQSKKIKWRKEIACPCRAEMPSLGTAERGWLTPVFLSAHWRVFEKADWFWSTSFSHGNRC